MSKPGSVLFAQPLPTWKRITDVVFATAGLAALSPILVTVAIAIKLTSPGPVLFKQERTGQNLRRFTMYKFRTMVEGAHRRIAEIRSLNQMTGPLIKIENDPRLTKIGHCMRQTSIDELPQLFNVLKGDMTFIGPRALSPLPSQYEPWQLERFDVVPGIACAWQAEHRQETDFVAWMRSDLEYQANSSITRDIRILIKTLKQVLTGRVGG